MVVIPLHLVLALLEVIPKEEGHEPSVAAGSLTQQHPVELFAIGDPRIPESPL